MTSLKLLGSSEIKRLMDRITPSFGNFSFSSWFPKLRVISDSVECNPALFWGMIKLVTIYLRLIAQLSIYSSYPFSLTLYALHWYTTLFCEKILKWMIFSSDLKACFVPFLQAGMSCCIFPMTWYSIYNQRYFSKNKKRSCYLHPWGIRFRRGIQLDAYFEINRLRCRLSSSGLMLAMKALFRLILLNISNGR